MPNTEKDTDSSVLKSLKKRKRSNHSEIQEHNDLTNTNENNDHRRNARDLPSQKKKKWKRHLKNNVPDSDNCDLEASENNRAIDLDMITDNKQLQSNKIKKFKKYLQNGVIDSEGCVQVETQDTQNSFVEASINNRENSDGKHLNNKPLLKNKNKHKNKIQNDVSDSDSFVLETLNSQNSFIEASVDDNTENLDTEHLKNKSLLKNKNKLKNKQKKRMVEFKTKNSSSSDTKKISSKKEKAIVYLEKWKNDKDNWKFEKLTQLWLLKNMFDSFEVPEKSFQILLEYLIDLRGASKNFAVQLCEIVFKKIKEKSSTDEKDELLEYSYQRARSIRQCLE